MIAARRPSPLLYFAYTGWTIAVVLLVTSVVRLRLGERGWMFTQQLIAVLVTTAGAFFLLVVRDQTTWLNPFAERFDRVLGRASSVVRAAILWIGAAVYPLAALAVLALDDRRFVLVIAIVQTTVVLALRPKERFGTRIAMAAVGVASWGLASGLSFTHLADWLLAGSPSTALAVPAFVATFSLVLYELASESPRPVAGPSRRRLIAAVAILAFVATALRSDNALLEWVPIHRSYFADVAQSVRDGHWLLWDVPSLYGFLSILAIAVMPARDAWQGLYELTALVLVFQSCVTYVMLRFGRSGWANALFAIAFPLAVCGDGLTRYAWSARLYPQGGLRFVWTVALLMVAFLSYIWNDVPARVRLVRAVGHACWLFGLLWSIENAVWVSAIWLPFVAVDAGLAAAAAHLSAGARARVFLARIAPLAVLPLLAYVAIETVYRSALRSHPDWRAFAEFTGLFTSGKIRAVFHVQAFGASWCILIVLGAVGALLIAALRLRRWAVVPLLVATWFAVWATSSYYAVEPLDLYVDLLLAVLVPASAIVIVVSRAFEPLPLATISRLSIAPLAIVSIAFLIGQPTQIAAMRWPELVGTTLDSTRAFPPLRGELATIVDRARIAPGDPVLFENGPLWTELDQGLVFPFARASDGSMVEYRAWLPVSPVGPQLLSDAMTPARRQTYIERYLARSRSAGWYVTYRHAASCRSLSRHLRTGAVLHSKNFSASFCVFVASDRA
ncbi:MAG: hypothetical protein NVS2B3_00220 [Vulcanimicrobiaceae bacterium]